MYSLKNTVLSATAIVAMVQYCPAPFLAVIPEAIAVGLETASDVIDVAGGKLFSSLIHSFSRFRFVLVQLRKPAGLCLYVHD